jgi:hypothetical protein
VYIYIYIYANVSTDTWFEALKKKHTLKLVFKAAWHCQKRIKKNKMYTEDLETDPVQMENETEINECKQNSPPGSILR